MPMPDCVRNAMVAAGYDPAAIERAEEEAERLAAMPPPVAVPEASPVPVPVQASLDDVAIDAPDEIAATQGEEPSRANATGGEIADREPGWLLRSLNEEPTAVSPQRITDLDLDPPWEEPVPDDPAEVLRPDPGRMMPGRYHADGPATERIAAAIVMPGSGTQRRKVLAAFQSAEDGCTDYELWATHGIGARPHVPGTRREELIADGWPITDSGKRRSTDTGAPAIVWVLADG